MLDVRPNRTEKFKIFPGLTFLKSTKRVWKKCKVPLLGAEPAWGAVSQFKGANRDFGDTALRAQSIPILLKLRQRMLDVRPNRTEKFKIFGHTGIGDTALRAQSIPILLKIAPADAGCAPKPHRKFLIFPRVNFSNIDEASLGKFAKCPCLGLNLRGAL